MTEPVGSVPGQANGDRNIMREALLLALAALLAGRAGIVDAIGYLHLSGLFVSYMSGNSTQLAVALGQGNLGEAGTIAELIALFVLGAAVGQVLADLTGSWLMTWVLTGVTILLAISAMLATAAEPMVFAMGALNASMHRAGRIAVSLTFVTGALVRFGQGLGHVLTGRTTEWNWLAQAVPWFGLIAGATIGSAVYMRIGEAAIWVGVVLAGLLAACSAAMRQPD
ncbi:MAG: YoaK family protein [Stellaceae bacterium]